MNDSLTRAKWSVAAVGLAFASALAGQTRSLPVPLPVISAPQWVVQHWLESPSGQASAPITLAAHQSAQPAQPASLTKLLTAYAALQLSAGSDAERRAFLTVSAQCAGIDGTRVGYRVGEKVAIEDAIQGLLAISGNDAACALAEHFDPVVAAMKVRFSENTPPSPTQLCPRLEDAGDFVGYMNAMSHPRFATLCQWRNPHGLSQQGHLSTANDIARIAHALWSEHPEVRPWLGRKTYRWNGLTQANRNSLLHWGIGVDGLKTGHTQAAGYNLATTQSQRVSVGSDAYDWRLATVVLGTASTQARANDSAALLGWVRANFQPWRLYGAGDLAGHWALNGVAEAAPLHYQAPLWAVLDKTLSPAAVRYVFRTDGKLRPPYAADSVVGWVSVMINDKDTGKDTELGSAPVVTLRELAPSPWYAFAWAWLKRGLGWGKPQPN